MAALLPLPLLCSRCFSLWCLFAGAGFWMLLASTTSSSVLLQPPQSPEVPESLLLGVTTSGFKAAADVSDDWGVSAGAALGLLEWRGTHFLTYVFSPGWWALLPRLMMRKSPNVVKTVNCWAATGTTNDHLSSTHLAAKPDWTDGKYLVYNDK